jgi:hypothetical protein
MKRAGLVWLLLAGILVTGVLAGCKSSTAVSFPLPMVPITQKIITRVQGNGGDIKNFKFYISAAVILERDIITESLQISDTGEGWLREPIVQEGIEIFPGTKGVLIKYSDANPNASTIEVCFDETDRHKTLTFIKNAVEDRYYLDYNRAEKNIIFNGETYNLRMFDNTSSPHLLIRYTEPITTNPNVQRLDGRTNESVGPAVSK